MWKLLVKEGNLFCSILNFHWSNLPNWACNDLKLFVRVLWWVIFGNSSLKYKHHTFIQSANKTKAF